MEENKEEISPTQEKVVCPNCNLIFSMQEMGTDGESFPCPKCDPLNSQKNSGKVSGDRILTKLVYGIVWILSAVIAFVVGFLLFIWAWSYRPERGREPLKAVNSSQASEGVMINTIGMKLKLIPAGSFIMGSDKGKADEKAVHKVTLSKPFYLGVHEVSVEQYFDIMAERPRMPMPPTKPMLFVTWHKAKEFCKKLSEKENARYRLPTEAEWEYSIRAGTQSEFYWGDKYTPGHEWCHYNSGRPTRSTQIIGTSEPNPWGLFDMAGNVQEWCEDYYANSFSPGEQTDPTGPTSGVFRVIRGGGYDMTEGALRSAYRGREDPDTQMGPGFRVVKEIQGG